MNKNGYTLVELLGVIVLVAIISGLAVISVSFIIQRGKENTYKILKSNLLTAARDYAFNKIKSDDDAVFNTGINSDEGFKIAITENEFKEFLGDFKAPDNDDCGDSYVIITKDNNISSTLKLNYKVCLICSGYKDSGDC